MIWINKEHYGGICRNCDHEMAHFSIPSDKNHSIEKYLPKQNIPKYFETKIVWSTTFINMKMKLSRNLSTDCPSI